LDAHARAYLPTVVGTEGIGAFVRQLRQVGQVLILNAEQRSVLSDPFGDDRVRKIAESSHEFLQTNPAESFEAREQRIIVAMKLIREDRKDEESKWRIWKRQILDRIELCFEARYRHWEAEAMDWASSQPDGTAGPFAKADVESGVARDGEAEAEVKLASQEALSEAAATWDQVGILFLSDERVEVRYGDRIETRNYAEFGFSDRRSGKPNQAWTVLRTLAEERGQLASPTSATGQWAKVEKQIQIVRKLLRGHFGIALDPIPFTKGSGYRCLFRLGCHQSYQT
jgi:hypothetical protein